MSINSGAGDFAIRTLVVAFAYPPLVQVAYDIKNMVETGAWVYALFLPLFGYFFRRTYMKMRSQAQAEGKRAGIEDANHEVWQGIIESLYQKQFDEKIATATATFTARLADVESDNKKLKAQVTVLIEELTKHNIPVPTVQNEVS